MSQSPSKAGSSTAQAQAAIREAGGDNVALPLQGRLKPWHTLPGQQVLCVGCLETRIGRTLTANDFLPVVLNDPGHGYKSDRLLDRLAGADWRERLAGQDWQDDDVSEPDDTLFGGGNG